MEWKVLGFIFHEFTTAKSTTSLELLYRILIAAVKNSSINITAEFNVPDFPEKTYYDFIW